MQQPKLRRLLEDELGECCDADVERRQAELETLAASVQSGTARERSALRTLGDETRFRLAQLLAAADRDLCFCELAPLVDVSESAVSHALGDLVDAGLVSRHKEGTWHYYETTERADQLLAALDIGREDA